MAEKLEWTCHTPSLLKEIMINPGMGILKIPMVVFCGLLDRVVIRASQLNDPALNALMCRLTLYEVSDPYSKIFDRDRVKEVYALAEKEV